MKESLIIILGIILLITLFAIFQGWILIILVVVKIYLMAKILKDVFNPNTNL